MHNYLKFGKIKKKSLLGDISMNDWVICMGEAEGEKERDKNLAWERTEMEGLLKNPVTRAANIGSIFAWPWLNPLF